MSRLEFLESLPNDGSYRSVEISEFGPACDAAKDGDAFLLSGWWPELLVSITFEGRKTLSRLRAKEGE